MERVRLAGKNFIIRTLEDSDLEGVQEFADYLNSLVDDPEVMILQKSKKTSDEEREWLLGRLPEIESISSARLAGIVISSGLLTTPLCKNHFSGSV